MGREDVHDHAVDADAARLGQRVEEDGHDDHLESGGGVQQTEAHHSAEEVAPGGQRATPDVARGERQDEVHRHGGAVDDGGVEEGGGVHHRCVAAVNRAVLWDARVAGHAEDRADVLLLARVRAGVKLVAVQQLRQPVAEPV